MDTVAGLVIGVYDIGEGKRQYHIGTLSTWITQGHFIDLWAQGEMIEHIHTIMQYLTMPLRYGQRPIQIMFSYDGETKEITSAALYP